MGDIIGTAPASQQPESQQPHPSPAPTQPDTSSVSSNGGVDLAPRRASNAAAAGKEASPRQSPSGSPVPLSEEPSEVAADFAAMVKDMQVSSAPVSITRHCHYMHVPPALYVGAATTTTCL